MTYVALLRGINVGGNTKIEMLRLKAVFESLGCRNVTTYINSGNVIYQDERKPDELVSKIEKEIKDEFNLDVPVVIRSFEEIKQLNDEVPDDWTNDKEQKTDVMFLWKNINDADILNKVVINPDIENVRHIDGALIWNIGRENITRGGSIKLIKTDLYKYITVRNINTVRKLCALMNEASQQ